MLLHVNIPLQTIYHTSIYHKLTILYSHMDTWCIWNETAALVNRDDQFIVVGSFDSDLVRGSSQSGRSFLKERQCPSLSWAVMKAINTTKQRGIIYYELYKALYMYMYIYIKIYNVMYVGALTHVTCEGVVYTLYMCIYVRTWFVHVHDKIMKKHLICNESRHLLPINQLIWWADDVYCAYGRINVKLWYWPDRV